jgi:hypothetical protein
LYRLAPRFGPELNAVIAQVRQDNLPPEARLQAVLRLVQRDIRYFGVEAGQGGYIPRPPDLVYKRRFGDCKDKALLMVAMLRAVGVDAAPALVNTTLNGAIQDRPPGPGAFDHVVVRATIGDNTYWLDPTRSSQNGTLGNLTQADFGMALVLAPDSKGLVSMRNPAGSRSFKAIHAVFDARAGLGHPVEYSVATTFSGVAADRVRAFMSSRSKEEIDGDYLNFYARGYANIRKATPIEIREDNDVNTVTTVEHYLIDDFWGEPRDDGRRTGYVHASEIDTLLKTPDQLNRTAPLKIAFPEEVEELTEVKLPGAWKVHPKNVEVHNAAFDFRHDVAAGTGDVTYVLTDHYEALAREVAPGDVRAYADDVKRADDAVGLTLHWDGSTTRIAQAAGHTSLATPVGAIALLVTWALLAAGCARSCPAHSAHDWYLFRHAVWISGVLWLIATAAHPGWTSHTMAIAVVYVGACKLLAGRAGAPESHWLFALDDGAARARRSWPARVCIDGLAFTPLLMTYAACGYYVWALLS